MTIKFIWKCCNCNSENKGYTWEGNEHWCECEKCNTKHKLDVRVHIKCLNMGILESEGGND